MDDDYKIKLVKTIAYAYVKSYDGETKWRYFLIEDDELLKKDNDISNKVSGSIKKELDCKPIHKNFF